MQRYAQSLKIKHHIIALLYSIEYIKVSSSFTNMRPIDAVLSLLLTLNIFSRYTHYINLVFLFINRNSLLGIY